MTRTLVLAVAVVAAVAGVLVSSRATARAVEARRNLVSELSATLGRARSLDVVAQQVRAETGAARPAVAMLQDSLAGARTGTERQLLRESLACLTDGGCADATAPITRAEEADGRVLDALWRDVDAAEADLQRAFTLTLGLALLAFVLAALAPRPAAPAPPADSPAPQPAPTEDSRALEDMLRARLEALYQARAQLGDSARFAAFGELAAALSHGLKTPLAGVLASVQLAQLKLGEANPARAELDEIVRLIEGLTEQVQRFLRASGKVGPQRQQMRCAEVLAQLEAAYAADAARRGIAFSVSNQAPAVMLAVDPSLLDMALRNLVENALAAVRGGQTVTVSAVETAAPPRVGLEATVPPAGARYVAFVVDDDGPGLPAAARRVEPGTTTREQGSGLGLAIARRVTERHDGALVLEDRPGGGTRIQLVLPVSGEGGA